MAVERREKCRGIRVWYRRRGDFGGKAPPLREYVKTVVERRGKIQDAFRWERDSKMWASSRAGPRKGPKKCLKYCFFE